MTTNDTRDAVLSDADFDRIVNSTPKNYYTQEAEVDPQDWQALIASHRALAAENDRLRQVLGWYADDANWLIYTTQGGEPVDVAIDTDDHDAWPDGGQRARAALAADDAGQNGEAS